MHSESNPTPNPTLYPRTNKHLADISTQSDHPKNIPKRDPIRVMTRFPKSHCLTSFCTFLNVIFLNVRYSYLRFDITGFVYSKKNATDLSKALPKFVSKVFKFCDTHLASGKSVLVHCLAGAHRAGTTGVSLIMHYTGMPAAKAIKYAQTCRRVVMPIGRFPLLLGCLEICIKENNKLKWEWDAPTTPTSAKD